MTPDELVQAIAGCIPKEVAAGLVREFLTIRQDFLTGTLGRAAPGKFVEELVRALQHLEKGAYEPKPDVDEYLSTVENKTKLDEGLRVCAARIGRSMYTLRNKRTIAHTGTVDPNHFDLAYLYHSAQWVLAELIRQCARIPMADAGRMIEYVQAPVFLQVEDFGGFQTVLADASVAEELLALLRHQYPEPVPLDNLKQSLRRRNPRSVVNSIRRLWEEKLTEKTDAGYKLTSVGVGRAEELLRSWIAARAI